MAPPKTMESGKGHVAGWRGCICGLLCSHLEPTDGLIQRHPAFSRFAGAATVADAAMDLSARADRFCLRIEPPHVHPWTFLFSRRLVLLSRSVFPQVSTGFCAATCSRGYHWGGGETAAEGKVRLGAGRTTPALARNMDVSADIYCRLYVEPANHQHPALCSAVGTADFDISSVAENDRRTQARLADCTIRRLGYGRPRSRVRRRCRLGLSKLFSLSKLIQLGEAGVRADERFQPRLEPGVAGSRALCGAAGTEACVGG